MLTALLSSALPPPPTLVAPLPPFPPPTTLTIQNTWWTLPTSWLYRNSPSQSDTCCHGYQTPPATLTLSCDIMYPFCSLLPSSSLPSSLLSSPPHRLFPSINIITELHYRYNIRFMRFTSCATYDMKNLTAVVSVVAMAT